MARLIKDQSPGTINVTFKIIFVTFSPQKCKFYEKMKKMCLNRILWKDRQVVKMNKYEKNDFRPLWFTLDSFKDTIVILIFFLLDMEIIYSYV